VPRDRLLVHAVNSITSPSLARAPGLVAGTMRSRS
jgi:hypothetical protein